MTILKGTVKNVNEQPIEGVSISYGNVGTSTDKRGKYQIRVPYKKEITITFNHISHKTFIKKYLSTIK